MIGIKNNNLLEYMKLLLFILALVLLYFLLKPLLNIVLASILLTYVFYPVYARVKIFLKRDFISIIATISLIILLFLMPLIFVASQMPKEASVIYSDVKNNLIESEIFNENCETSETFYCKAYNLATGSGFFELEDMLDSLFKKISELAATIVIAIPNGVASMIIALVISYFLFKDGKKILENAKEIIPLSKKHSDNMVKKFQDVTNSVVYAHIIVAIAQGALGAIGFYIFGINSPIFWGVIMTIFALIPLIGPMIIWFPAALLKLFGGITFNSYWDVGMGIGLLAYGVLVISTVDNLIRIKLIGDSSNVHPLTVILGILGGISLFGFMGIFIGPILLSLLITFFRDFAKSYNSRN